MPIQIIRADITKITVDAVVNAANERLYDGGGVNGAIHKAAGPKLHEECIKLGGCRTGEAKVTRGYEMPCKYIIHTVGPVWQGGEHGEEELLKSCYRNSLKLAQRKRCESIAFPLISSGIFGYPKAQALQVATQTISEFLLKHEMLVYIVVFDKAAFEISGKLFSDIKAYIDDNYADRFREERRFRELITMNKMCAEDCAPAPMLSCASAPMGLDDFVSELDESFSQMLLRKIDEKGIKDSECYKKANISRKLFSKIRSDIHYKPSKPTVLAFAIALELSLEDTKEMLEKAGFALSHSNYFDLIVEYFIINGNYNIFEINEALFRFDQSLLGG